MDFTVIGENLQFPEGPIALPDGSVLLVEIARGTLTRAWGDGKTEVVAEVGGGPNGAALGPDGAVYITNNGGFETTRDANGRLMLRANSDGDHANGGIDRVDLATGKFERIYTHCGEHPLRGPNDLVFDKTGGFWFTDLGKTLSRSRDMAGLYYAQPDGSSVKEIHFGGLSFNGVGLSPDEKTVYVADTHNARLWAYDLESPGQLKHEGGRQSRSRLIAGLPYHALLDSLAVTEAGNICVGTLVNGGITTFRPDGAHRHTAFPDTLVTNICFGGTDRLTAYITLSATGQLIKAQWPEPGLALNFSQY